MGYELQNGIVVVSVEDAVKPIFIQILKEQAQTKRLARIVFDEVHLTQEHSSFRTDMSKVWELGSVEVPIAWLSQRSHRRAKLR